MTLKNKNTYKNILLTLIITAIIATLGIGISHAEESQTTIVQRFDTEFSNAERFEFNYNSDGLLTEIVPTDETALGKFQEIYNSAGLIMGITPTEKTAVGGFKMIYSSDGKIIGVTTFDKTVVGGFKMIYSSDGKITGVTTDYKTDATQTTDDITIIECYGDVALASQHGNLFYTDCPDDYDTTQSTDNAMCDIPSDDDPSTGVFITTDGKLGIGTDDPSAYLDIKGNEKNAIAWDNGKALLQNSYDAFIWDRQLLNVFVDADNNQDSSKFQIFNDVSSSSGNTPAVSFGLDNQDSWIDSGNFGFGTTKPNSKLEVTDGYFELDTSAGTPPSTDCDASNEVGRMKVDSTASSNKLYVCTPSGWATK